MDFVILEIFSQEYCFFLQGLHLEKDFLCLRVLAHSIHNNTYIRAKFQIEFFLMSSSRLIIPFQRCSIILEAGNDNPY